MTADDATLLAAILAAPDDDAPRLAYADWLAGRDDARAEIIRVQCELARDGVEPRRSIELRKRSDELLKAHKEWDAPLRNLGLHCNWKRGFPSTIIGGGKKFLAARPLIAELPVDTLVLTADLKDTIGAVAASPELARFAELELSCGAADDRVTAGWALGDAGFATLVGSPHLSRLRRFTSGWNNLHADGLKALADAAFLPSLTTLCIRDNPSTAGGFAALAKPPRLQKLRGLDLFRCFVGAEGAAALAAAEMRDLEWLRLAESRVETAGAVALAGSASLGNLRKLELGSCGIKGEGAAAIARSPHLRSLVELGLTRNAIGPDGALAFAAAVERTVLRSLDLAGNVIGVEGARALAGSDAMPALTSLNVSENNLGVDGVTAFVEGKGLTALRSLYINWNIWSDRVEQWTDWNGSVTGEGPVREDLRETAARFAAAKPNLHIG
jgi:uncharacterized protein (TIGR02996 family)